MRFEKFFEIISEKLGDAGLVLAAKTENSLKNLRHGDFDNWLKAVDSLPAIKPKDFDLNSDAVRIGIPSDCTAEEKGKLQKLLQQFHPWRKGPLDFFGINIDTEWRSDMKWDRLCREISSLQGKRVLDVGCGNGYHCLRAAGAGADVVVGIDPFVLYVMQFQAINRYLGLDNVSVLPLGVEDLPFDCGCFDTVFSMGVLYHRRDASAHIKELAGMLAAGGELVLETLVIESDTRQSLQPKGRYAKMRNVWEIPSPSLLLDWLKEAGFGDVRIADITKTTSQEQRKTDWMRFESLTDFLNPDNPNLTIEGYPAPVRAVCIAKK